MHRSADRNRSPDSESTYALTGISKASVQRRLRRPSERS